jgi:AcrR family transcriptional regulator
VKDKCFISGFKKSKDRKAQERESRDLLILDVASTLLVEGGLQSLTMQAIANNTDYSKGTIYQHYGCKEDVITQLVIISSQQLVSLIEKALLSGLSLRHKIALVSTVFFLNAQSQPEVARLVGLVKSAGFRVKVSAKYGEKLAENENIMLQHILSMFGSGSGFSEQKILDAAFGWWSMQWGVMDIMSNGWDVEKLGYKEPEQCFFRSLHLYLDGLGIEVDPQCHEWTALQAQAKIIIKMENNNEALS